MRRTPNPWIALPALGMGALAGVIGWVVTDVSCRQGAGVDTGSGCVGWALGIAVTSGILVAAGTALVLVLVYRSLAEWQQSQAGEEGEGSRHQ
ncbi:MAG TPA: hypothetical protein EYP73_02200 [Acidimicrobiia bacterium]|nr:hypothetical protein [Acidimicrobiia bacterium]